MRCEQAEPLMGAWQDGELGLVARFRVKRHVKRCAACRLEAERLESLTRCLSSIDPLNGWEIPRGFARPLLVRFAPAVALAACAGSLWVLTGRQTPRPGTPPSVPVTRTASTGSKAHTAREIVTVMPALAPSVVRSTRAQRAHEHVFVYRSKTTARRRHPMRLARHVTPRLKGRAIAKTLPASREIIQISVKISEPQEVIRQVRADVAQIQRIEASRPFIYVAATPAPMPLIPQIPFPEEPASLTDAPEEKP